MAKRSEVAQHLAGREAERAHEKPRHETRAVQPHVAGHHHPSAFVDGVEGLSDDLQDVLDLFGMGPPVPIVVIHLQPDDFFRVFFIWADLFSTVHPKVRFER